MDANPETPGMNSSKEKCQDKGRRKEQAPISTGAVTGDLGQWQAGIRSGVLKVQVSKKSPKILRCPETSKTKPRWKVLIP